MDIAKLKGIKSIECGHKKIMASEDSVSVYEGAVLMEKTVTSEKDQLMRKLALELEQSEPSAVIVVSCKIGQVI